MKILRSMTGSRLTPWIAAGLAFSLLVIVWVFPVDAQKKEPQKRANMMKDVFVQYLGKATNLGTLKNVAGDYVVLEGESGSTMYPFHAIQAFKLVKGEEGAEVALEIRLLSRE